MRRKKSQAWSMDIIFAVVIFIGAFFTFYFLAKPFRDIACKRHHSGQGE